MIKTRILFYLGIIFFFPAYSPLYAETTLDTLGYIGPREIRPDTTSSVRHGVIRYDSRTIRDGVNFLVPAGDFSARLIDTHGHVLHRWELKQTDTFPEPYRKTMKTVLNSDGSDYWRDAVLHPNGDVTALILGRAILRVNRKSEVQWIRQIPVHHSIDVDSRGHVYGLTKDERVVPGRDTTTKVRVDRILELNNKGHKVSSHSILKAFHDSDYKGVLLNAELKGNFMHANSVTVIEDDYEFEVFKPGRLLISIREWNTVAVYDPKQKKIIWALKGLFTKQHNPLLTENGNLLVFDNFWKHTENNKRSRIVLIDPETRKIIWSYSGQSLDSLYSKCCGAARMLSNGNVLIAETGRGRALEVTRSGRIAWMFLNPVRGRRIYTHRIPLFHVYRYRESFFKGWQP